MFGLDYVLAIALLTAPPDTPVDGAVVEMHAALRPTLQAVGIEWEILDPREVRYILTRAEDFPSDLNLLRRRYEDLVSAPTLQDCFRFPDREMVSDVLSFNRAYRQHLLAKQPLQLVYWWELRTALQETDNLYQIW